MVQNEFDAELPVDVDGSDATGTGPLASAGADFDARLTMRDVILVRKGSKLKLGKTRKGHFNTRYEPNVGGLVIPVDRGWASVEAAQVGLRQEGQDEPFRFVDTHLEAFGDPTIREAQAKELTKGPLKTAQQVVLVGDLNSGIARHNEPEQPGDDLAFKALAGFGMHDNGAVQSCCYHEPLRPGRDLRPHGRPRPHEAEPQDGEAFVTGHAPGERTASGLWPSDHGGVVSTAAAEEVDGVGDLSRRG